MTLALQSAKTTVLTVRYISDKVINELPSTSNLLSSTANLILNKTFENGLIKTQDSKEATLENSESDAFCQLKLVRAI